MMCHGDFFEHLLLEREGNCEGWSQRVFFFFLFLFLFISIVYSILRSTARRVFLLPRKGILGVTVLLSASFVEYLVKK